MFKDFKMMTIITHCPGIMFLLNSVPVKRVKKYRPIMLIRVQFESRSERQRKRKRMNEQIELLKLPCYTINTFSLHIARSVNVKG